MAAERLQPWSRRLRDRLGSVRVRTTAGAVIVVGVALLVGSVALVAVVRDTLTGDRREIAWSRAEEVVARIESSGSPAPLPTADEDQIIQVLDASGAVMVSTENVMGRAAVARPAPGDSFQIRLELDELLDFVAVAVAAPGPSGQLTVIVAQALDDVAEATEILARLLIIGVPLLLFVVAFTSWRVVGRALAPVEAMRSEVDGISAAGLYRRVPAPGGGDEISRLALTMNRMLERLQGAQARQRRFISDASHELRSPVASIRQHAEVALAHPDRTTLAELAETVLAEDLRVQRLVEDLLLLARADELTLAPADQAVDVDDLIFEEARRLRDTTRLRVDTAGVSAGRIRGEPAQLRRMIRNLVDNAARHARSRVAFSLSEQDDGSVVLRLDDDGAGIRVDERQRIFDRFVRLDDARARDHGGSGLGLAIVAEVVAHHGGTVSAAEAPGGGARLEVRLPRLAD